MSRTRPIPDRASRYQLSSAAALLALDQRTVKDRLEDSDDPLTLAADQSGVGLWLDGPAVDAARDRMLADLAAVDARPGPEMQSEGEASLRRQLVRAQEEGRRAMRMLRDALGSMDDAFVPSDPQLAAELSGAHVARTEPAP